MAIFVCSICGYTHEGNEAPGRCPVCKSPSSAFTLHENVDSDEKRGQENAVNANENLDSGETLQEIVNNQEATTDITKNANTVINQKDGCYIEEDVNEILKFGAANLQAVKWYKEKHKCGLKEAKDAVDSIFDKRSDSTITHDEHDDSYPVVNNDDNGDNKGKSGKKSCLIVLGILSLFFILGGILSNIDESKQNEESKQSDSIAGVDSVEIELDIKSQEYVKKHLEEILNQSKDEGVEKSLTKLFSKDFVNLYREVEDFDNKNVEEGCIGFWDFNFWTGGQDGELQSVKVLEIKDMTENRAFAIVQFLIKFGDNDESKVSKVFELTFEGDEWRIDDFDNYKWRFKNYIESCVNQSVEKTDSITVDTCVIAE